MKLLSIYICLFLLMVLTSCSGPRGNDGLNGAPGSSCEVIQLENGAEIKCGDLTSAIILNGSTGPKGEDMVEGPHPVMELINPCGKQGTHDEIIIRIGTGELLAHYSDNKKQFFTVLAPGNYQTTDGTNCNFSVSNNLTVTW